MNSVLLSLPEVSLETPIQPRPAYDRDKLDAADETLPEEDRHADDAEDHPAQFAELFSLLLHAPATRPQLEGADTGGSPSGCAGIAEDSQSGSCRDGAPPKSLDPAGAGPVSDVTAALPAVATEQRRDDRLLQSDLTASSPGGKDGSSSATETAQSVQSLSPADLSGDLTKREGVPQTLNPVPSTASERVVATNGPLLAEKNPYGLTVVRKGSETEGTWQSGAKVVQQDSVPATVFSPQVQQSAFDLPDDGDDVSREILAILDRFSAADATATDARDVSGMPLRSLSVTNINDPLLIAGQIQGSNSHQRVSESLQEQLSLPVDAVVQQDQRPARAALGGQESEVGAGDQIRSNLKAEREHLPATTFAGNDLPSLATAELRQPLSAQVSRAIVQHFERNADGNAESLTVRLDPPELGELTIELERNQDGLSVRVTAREAVTMDMLLARGSEIETQLRQRDLNLSDIQFQMGGFADSPSGSHSRGDAQTPTDRGTFAAGSSAKPLRTSGNLPMGNRSGHGLSFRA